MENKIKYGLKNVHYALVTEIGGVVTYGTPVAIAGAVSLALSAKGDKTEFYADDGEYFTNTANNGYEGTLEMALIPDSFRAAVLGEKQDVNNALIEDSNAISKKIALMYEFSGDAKATRHVSYKVSVARPSIESNTKGSSIDPVTDTLDITASPATDTGYVKGKLKAGDTGYDTFYSAVYLENAAINTATANTVTFSKAAPADVSIDATSTDVTNTVKNVTLDGFDIGGINLTATGADVVIASDYVAALDNGTYAISVEFDKGNAIAITLTVAA